MYLSQPCGSHSGSELGKECSRIIRPTEKFPLKNDNDGRYAFSCALKRQ